MKIKLIIPKFNLRPMDSEFKRLMSPLLALLTVISLTPKEYEVYIEDENIQSINYYDNPDLVGITVNTLYKAYEITKFRFMQKVGKLASNLHIKFKNIINLEINYEK